MEPTRAPHYSDPFGLYRHHQHNDYMRSLEDETIEPTTCDICNHDIECEEISLGPYKYCCEGCIRATMEEEQVNRTNAIVLLTEISKRYGRSF